MLAIIHDHRLLYRAIRRSWWEPWVLRLYAVAAAYEYVKPFTLRPSISTLKMFDLIFFNLSVVLVFVSSKVQRNTGRLLWAINFCREHVGSILSRLLRLKNLQVGWPSILLWWMAAGSMVSKYNPSKVVSMGAGSPPPWRGPSRAIRSIRTWYDGCLI